MFYECRSTISRCSHSMNEKKAAVCNIVVYCRGELVVAVYRYQDNYTNIP